MTIIQINADTREQGSDEEQANEMVCLLLRHAPAWPSQGAWRTMNEVTLIAPGESCDFDLVNLELL
jgi:hypothetical protein